MAYFHSGALAQFYSGVDTPGQKHRNARTGPIRAKVEHVFRVLKCQFGYRKARYRGIAKNGAQVFALLALANLFLARRQLTCA